MSGATCTLLVNFKFFSRPFGNLSPYMLNRTHLHLPKSNVDQTTKKKSTCQQFLIVSSTERILNKVTLNLKLSLVKLHFFELVTFENFTWEKRTSTKK